MRLPRFIYLVAGFFVIPFLLTLLSLVTSSRRNRDASSSVPAADGKGRFRALLSFTSPSSLFPPSAIISLTDDNSTFFLARPAAFGPLLATKGLSGQLWVGSGFGDDNSVRGGGAASGAEGELGCSDVPGWGEGDESSQAHVDTVASGRTSEDGGRSTKDNDGEGRRGSSSHAGGSDHLGRHGGLSIPRSDEDASPPSRNDGTDDYLHHPLHGTDVFKPSRPGEVAHKIQEDSKSGKPHHADIQSLQEGAEIAGRVVLLSRGGCGFLEKVKWTQRRGGIALIVGDNTRGGGLVTMYAQGDTSNVTIPSVFTSHTTAHLLSSLIPAEGIAEDGTSKPASKDGTTPSKVKLGSKKKKHKGKKSALKKDGTTFTPIRVTASKTQATAPPTAKPVNTHLSSEVGSETSFQVQEKVGWVRLALSKIGFGGSGPSSSSSSVFSEDSRRPPSSGQLDWVLVEDWMDGDISSQKKTTPAASVGAGKDQKEAEAQQGSPASGSAPPVDDFIIGVQDWRDPDLIELPPKDESVPSKSTTSASQEATSKSDASRSKTSLVKGKAGKELNTEELEGGSITPGSGEYQTPEQLASGMLGQDASQSSGKAAASESDDGIGRGWFDHIPWLGPEGDERRTSDDTPSAGDEKDADTDGSTTLKADGDDVEEEDPDDGGNEEHEGLWVTLTPASMSTSPFFDTLLVLVVSPLVTLTVVYAMLLLRSRIRRRRWRAPKSVVERLPVRTYQAAPPSSSSSSSSNLTMSGASTPPPSSLASRSRPRSRTASCVMSVAEMARSRPASLHERAATTDDGPEKYNRAGSPGWNRRYSGRQVECVVCLEEYVNGVSKVMRLPCGHEFHVDCITPWLTTRRRTCPICKGDVVRSLAQASSSSSASLDTAPYRDDPDAVLPGGGRADIGNEIPATAVAIGGGGRSLDGEGHDADVERGEASPLLDHAPRPGRSRWTGLLGISLDTIREYSGSFGRDSARRRAREERDR